MDNETIEKEELKTRSIRATAGTFDALKKIADEAHFDNQGSALSALISLWEEQNAKQVMPEQGQVIDDVRSHLQAISNIFISQLDSMANTTNRVRGDYQARMDAQDKTISNLHQQLEEAHALTRIFQKDANLANEVKEDLQKSLDEWQASCERLKAQAEKESQEKASLAATIQTLTEVNASQKAEIAGMAEQIAHVKETEQKLAEQESSMSDKDKKIAQLQEQLEAANKAAQDAEALARENASLKEEKCLADQQHAHELEKAGIEKEKAVLAEQSKAQAAISSLQAEFIKRFDNSRK
jgi:chromosome segregation ATPase